MGTTILQNVLTGSFHHNRIFLETILDYVYKYVIFVVLYGARVHACANVSPQPECTRPV